MKLNDIIGAFKTPISFFTGNKVTIALIVVILALIVAFSVTVIVYKAEIKSLKADLKQEQLQGILLQDSLQQANSAIDKQNKEIERIRIDNDKAREILQQKLDNITKEKKEIILQAEQSLLQDSSCENKLSIINNTQMEYLNE